MPSGANVVLYAGLLIGLVYGAVGLLSGFCLMSSLRGWWAEGDSRLIRSFALALGVAIAATQLLAAGGLVDLGKTIYLQPSFSAPLMFFGGLLFGYGMVLSNGCGSRALVLLGRGNLRSFVVVIVLGIAAQMTLKGLIAPARIAVLQASLTAPNLISLPARSGLSGSFAQRCRARSPPRRSADCRGRAAPARASRSRSTAPCRSRTAIRRRTSRAPRTRAADRSTCRDRRRCRRRA